MIEGLDSNTLRTDEMMSILHQIKEALEELNDRLERLEDGFYECGEVG